MFALIETSSGPTTKQRLYCRNNHHCYGAELSRFFTAASFMTELGLLLSLSKK